MDADTEPHAAASLEDTHLPSHAPIPTHDHGGVEEDGSVQRQRHTTSPTQAPRSTTRNTMVCIFNQHVHINQHVHFNQQMYINEDVCFMCVHIYSIASMCIVACVLHVKLHTNPPHGSTSLILTPHDPPFFSSCACSLLFHSFLFFIFIFIFHFTQVLQSVALSRPEAPPGGYGAPRPGPLATSTVSLQEFANPVYSPGTLSGVTLSGHAFATTQGIPSHGGDGTGGGAGGSAHIASGGAGGAGGNGVPHTIVGTASAAALPSGVNSTTHNHAATTHAATTRDGGAPQTHHVPSVVGGSVGGGVAGGSSGGIGGGGGSATSAQPLHHIGEWAALAQGASTLQQVEQASVSSWTEVCSLCVCGRVDTCVLCWVW